MLKEVPLNMYHETQTFKLDPGFAGMNIRTLDSTMMEGINLLNRSKSGWIDY